MIDFRHLALLPEEERIELEWFWVRGMDPRPTINIAVHNRVEQVIEWTMGYAPTSMKSMEFQREMRWNWLAVEDRDSEQLLELMLELDMGD